MELEIKGLRISHKLALILLTTAIIAMSIIGILYHRQSLTTMEGLVEKHVNLVGTQIRGQLEKAIEQTNERVALISSRTQLRVLLSNQIQSPESFSTSRLSKIITDAKNSLTDIQQITINNNL